MKGVGRKTQELPLPPATYSPHTDTSTPTQYKTMKKIHTCMTSVKKKDNSFIIRIIKIKT